MLCEFRTARTKTIHYHTLYTCSVNSEQLELNLSTIQALYTCSVSSEQLVLRLTTILHYSHVVQVQNNINYPDIT